MRKHQSDNYEQAFIRFSISAEKIILWVLAGLVGITLLAQTVLQFPMMRQWITKVDRLEGDPYPFPGWPDR